eukprot:NODE_10_length_3212_cov_29.751702_g9_i0.p1 GENE.NODE_10_length_3212_cov_29.751702_g9_i0~~NODE_10_length_3212_cov_29.751702_g9_i0.p1  ORF type:complete len:641 (-),score=182.67 NODE_10_length_3212_cov_29.751702_g9_i0:1041-2963(-)
MTAVKKVLDEVIPRLTSVLPTLPSCTCATPHTNTECINCYVQQALQLIKTSATNLEQQYQQQQAEPSSQHPTSGQPSCGSPVTGNNKAPQQSTTITKPTTQLTSQQARPVTCKNKVTTAAQRQPTTTSATPTTQAHKRKADSIEKEVNRARQKARRKEETNGPMCAAGTRKVSPKASKIEEIDVDALSDDGIPVPTERRKPTRIRTAPKESKTPKTSNVNDVLKTEKAQKPNVTPLLGDQSGSPTMHTSSNNRGKPTTTTTRHPNKCKIATDTVKVPETKTAGGKAEDPIQRQLDPHYSYHTYNSGIKLTKRKREHIDTDALEECFTTPEQQKRRSKPSKPSSEQQPSSGSNSVLRNEETPATKVHPQQVTTTTTTSTTQSTGQCKSVPGNVDVPTKVQDQQPTTTTTTPARDNQKGKEKVVEQPVHAHDSAEPPKGNSQLDDTDTVSEEKEASSDESMALKEDASLLLLLDPSAAQITTTTTTTQHDAHKRKADRMDTEGKSPKSRTRRELKVTSKGYYHSANNTWTSGTVLWHPTKKDKCTQSQHLIQGLFISPEIEPKVVNNNFMPPECEMPQIVQVRRIQDSDHPLNGELALIAMDDLRTNTFIAVYAGELMRNDSTVAYDSDYLMAPAKPMVLTQ